MLFMVGLFGLLFFSDVTLAQLPGSRTSGERSSAFEPAYEISVEHSLAEFRYRGAERLSAAQLAQLQTSNLSDYSLQDNSLSLDLFRSLAAYYRRLPYAAQSCIDAILENAPSSSRIATDAALLGALEFYAHSPLRRSDVEQGLSRLNAIATDNAAPAPVQPEIRFWKAEGYRALGEYDQAEREYKDATVKSSDPRLTGLTYFRMAELFEREQRYAAADSNFAKASEIPESPLRLLAVLRQGAVQRTEKNYRAVLTTMEKAESLYRSTQHMVPTSARDLSYSSPLVEELLLRSTEHDRILGSANPPENYAIPPQRVSPFFESEIDLLRGAALSAQGHYAEATDILLKGDELIDGARDSANDPAFVQEARFVSDAIRFQRGWSLFEQAKYKDAAAAFLELVSADSDLVRHRIIRETVLPLREQGIYFDPFINDSLERAGEPVLDRSVLSKISIDTSFFIYNDFPERARYYAGIALARAGMLDEAAQTLQPLTMDKAMLYSDEATYQLALIRFEEHSYEAQKLLVPVSYERGVRGGYASFLLGELAYRQSDYERAEEYFSNAFALVPTTDTEIRATAHLERGLSLIPLGNWSEAADELATYLHSSHEQLQGKTDEAMFWLGKAYFRAREYDSAAHAYHALLDEFPTSSRRIDAQYGYAWSLFEANDFERAEPEFERVIAMDSITRYAYDVLARAGDAEYALGNYQHANHLYNRAVDRPTFNQLLTTRAMLMLGITRLKNDSARSAMNEFQTLATKYPASDVADLALFDYGLSAYSINLTDAAESMMDRVARKYPKSPVAPRSLFVAAGERIRRNDVRGSLPFYEQVLNDYPRSPEAGPALFGLQDALADLKRIPEALAVADTFVARNPDNPINPSVLLRAGEFKLRLGEPASALTTFQTFVANYPTHPARPRAELLIAESELATHDTNSAMASLDSIISRYDSIPEIGAQAYLDRARIEVEEGSMDTAAGDFIRAYQDQYYSADAAPQAMLEYGNLLAGQHKTDSAIAVLTSLSTHYPIEASISARGAIRAGELLAAQHKNDSARTLFGRVSAAHPTDEWGGLAQAAIGETYLSESNWSLAATAFTSARRIPHRSSELEGEALLGLAKAQSHLGRKADAIRNLHLLLGTRGVPSADRASAESLLSLLEPRKKPEAPPAKNKKTATKHIAAKKQGKKGGKR